jgi:FAD/FMN-containing dehydrogenase
VEYLLSILKDSGRRIFLFIDGPRDGDFHANSAVLEVAQSYVGASPLEIQHPEKNWGVGLGVPHAIDWVFNHVSEVIILEDDCIPSAFALDYFDRNIALLQDSVIMNSGSNPLNKYKSETELTCNSTISFPLIWGWATNIASWNKINYLIEKPIPHIKILKTFLRKPRKAKELAFFYAAAIRIAKGNMAAWDSPVALSMVLDDLQGILPSVNLFSNNGRDSSAHHFELDLDGSENVQEFETIPASLLIDLSETTRIENDLIMKKYIYGIRPRHLLSPIMALLGF